MEDSVRTQTNGLVVDHQDAWQMVLSQLHSELSRSQFETWVEPLRPLVIVSLIRRKLHLASQKEPQARQRQ